MRCPDCRSVHGRVKMSCSFCGWSPNGIPSEMDDDVADFHGRFDHPTFRGPTLPEREVLDFRIKLIREECDELCEALAARDLGRIAQEAVDVLYVAFGTLVICGLRARPFWNLIHRANMAKAPNPEGGKPLKPPGWTKPDCWNLIDRGKVTDLDYPETLRVRGDWPMDRSCGDDI